MSLRFAPPSSNPTETSNLTTREQVGVTASRPSKGAPSAPGLPDTLRNKITLPATADASSTNFNGGTPSSTHPLEARLMGWRATQEKMKMEGLRRAYGIAEPVRRGMELKMVRDSTFGPAVLGGTRNGVLHEDILRGSDAEIGWEDIYSGDDEFREPPTFHDEMEKRLRMDF